MNGRDLALGGAVALAVAGIALQRGSPARTPATVDTGWPTWPAMRRFLEERWRWDDLTDAERAARRRVGPGYVDHLREWEYRVIATLHRRYQGNPARHAEAVESTWADIQFDLKLSPLRRFKKKDAIRVWRKLLAPSIDDVRLDGLGLYWSWAREGPVAYWTKWGDDRELREFLIEGMARTTDVHWPATLIKNITAPEEWEIELVPGAVVTDLSIVDVETGEVVQVEQSGTANRGHT